MLINQMPGLALDTTTATAGKIFNGYTAYNGNGELVTGTAMAISVTARAPDILSSKTAYNQNGEVITGTLIQSNPVATIATTFPSGSSCSCSNGVITLSGGTSGSYTFNIPSAGVWTVSCTNGSETASKSISIVANTQSCSLSYITYLRVGGRIFYDNGSNGNTYRFFDSGYNEITDFSIAGLANAYYYAITAGSSSTARFYVYDNTHNLVSSKTWGKYGTSCSMTNDGIGYGKTNTATMMSKSPDGTMWTWLRDTVNANNTGGCNDWFIASKAEQDKLRSSGLVNWYSNNSIWSSVETNSSNAYYWNYDRSLWSNYGKDYDYCAFAARAF